MPSIATIPATSTSPVAGDVADRIVRTANQTSGWRFNAQETTALKARLLSDGTLARRHDESAVIAAFINGDGNAVVTFDSAQTIAIDPDGVIVRTFSPTAPGGPGGQLHVSMTLIFFVAMSAIASIGLAGLLIYAATLLRQDSSSAKSLLRIYCLFKIPVGIAAGAGLAALTYQTDTGHILGTSGVMARTIVQGALLIVVGITFPVALLVYLKNSRRVR
jgi:hypothetical protein